MAQRILLGPQGPDYTLRQAAERLGADGPAIVITAGWRDEEGEIDELQEAFGQPLQDLGIYRRADEIFVREPALRDLQRQRQDSLRELQDLYRVRLEPTLAGARRLLRSEGTPELLRVEQRAAINQLRALDRHHLRRIQAIHREFDRRRALLDIPAATAAREAVQERLAAAGLVLIAGGHVAVLLNRIRLFRLGELLARKPLIAWSAGAMALSERIVLFHHHAPQGRRDAELLDAGLGIVRGRVLLPHAATRLDWSNRKRMALFSRRFAPASCNTLDEGSWLHLDQDRLLASSGSNTISRKGRARGLGE